MKRDLPPLPTGGFGNHFASEAVPGNLGNPRGSLAS